MKRSLLAGRITQETLPDGRAIEYSFDYTPVDLTKDYMPLMLLIMSTMPMGTVYLISAAEEPSPELMTTKTV